MCCQPDILPPLEALFRSAVLGHLRASSGLDLEFGPKDGCLILLKPNDRRSSSLLSPAFLLSQPSAWPCDCRCIIQEMPGLSNFKQRRLLPCVSLGFPFAFPLGFPLLSPLASLWRPLVFPFVFPLFPFVSLCNPTKNAFQV